MIAHSCPEHSFTNPSTLVAISGSGNVAQFTALKVIELGATAKSLSDSKGSLIATKGFTKEDIQSIGQLKLKGGTLEAWAVNQDPHRFTYHAGMLLITECHGGGMTFTVDHRQTSLDPSS
jgi:glutamate dehydrogenase (NADP+)